MNRHLNVLISSVGKRVELIQCLRKTFEIMHINGRIIGIDISKDAPGLYFCDKGYIVRRCDRKEYISDIISIAIEENIDLIVPTIDTELPFLANNKNKIEAATKANVVVSDSSVIETFFSKTKTDKLFKTMGFKVPRTYKSIEQVNKYPIIIKPDRGSAAKGIAIINSCKAFEMFLSENKAEFIQDLINGKEITVDIFCNFNGDLKSVCMRERLRVRDGEVQIGKTLFDDEIYEKIRELCKKVKFVGGSTVQVIKNKNGIYFIECNPRFGGGLPFSIYAGANSWEYLLKTHLKINYSIKPGKNYRKNIIYSRFDQTIEIK